MRTVASYFALLTLVWMQLSPLTQASLRGNQEEMPDQFSNISLRKFPPAFQSFLENQTHSPSYSPSPGLSQMVHWGSVINNAQGRLTSLLPKKTNQSTLHLLRQPASLASTGELTIPIGEAPQLYEGLEERELIIPIVAEPEVALGLGAPNELGFFQEIQADIIREPAGQEEELNVPNLQLMVLAAQKNGSMLIPINEKDKFESPFLLQDETSRGNGSVLWKRQDFSLPNRPGSLTALMAGSVYETERPLIQFISGRSLLPMYEGSQPQVRPLDSLEPESDSLRLQCQKKEMIIPAHSTLVETTPVESAASGDHILLAAYASGVLIHILFLLLIF